MNWCDEKKGGGSNLFAQFVFFLLSFYAKHIIFNLFRRHLSKFYYVLVLFVGFVAFHSPQDGKPVINF